jgi:hypothetical protein
MLITLGFIRTSQDRRWHEDELMPETTYTILIVDDETYSE